MAVSALVRGRLARDLQLGTPGLVLAAGRRHTAETIWRAWAQNKSPHTVSAYYDDLGNFAAFFSRALGISPRLKPLEAMTKLFQQSAPSANEIAIHFSAYLQGAHLSPATVNRHISTLRSLTKLARMLGLITWMIEIPNVRHERRRSTLGPTVPQVREMLAATSADTEAETRDHAIITVFFCLGLRVAELCTLDLRDIDLTARTAWILGKGRREKELVPLPAPVVAAIRRYLPYRGTSAGPLFQSRGNRGKHRDQRLETRSVLRIVRTLGQKIGLHVWCHGLRHTSVTTAAEQGQRVGLGLDKVRAHSRHANLATLTLYLDDHDRQGTKKTLADLVGSALVEKDGA
jgi:integrase/recombinase XerC